MKTILSSNGTSKVLCASLAAGLSLGACGGAQKKETNTAASETSHDAKNENAPKPSMSDDDMAQKQAAAQAKAKNASVNERKEFTALVDSFQAAKAKPGGIAAGDCSSWSKKFTSGFGSGAFAAQAHFNAGTILESCGQAKDAESEYNASLRANPGYGPSLSNLGNVYFKQGNVGTAKEWFDKAIKADPTHNASAYNNLAVIEYQQARENNDPALYKDAISKLRRALAIDSYSIAAYALLAQIYYQTAENDRSKLDLAALVCRQAKEANDKFAPIYNTLGLINLKKKNVTGALAEFEKAVALDPKFVEAHLNIGAIGISARQYDKAEKSFTAVLAQQPNNFDATVGMGVAERGLKKFDDAEKWYTKAAALDPKNCSLPYNLGLLYQDYKVAEDNSNLRKAQEYFRSFQGCGKQTKEDKKRVEDATRRVKDIDDTFAAIEEQKKMESENKKMMEEAQKMEEQQKAAAAAAEAAEKDKKPAPAPAKK